MTNSAGQANSTTIWHFFPRPSGLCLFITLYISLFVVAGAILFGSLVQFRQNRLFAQSGSNKRFCATDNSAYKYNAVKSSKYYENQWEKVYGNESREENDDLENGSEFDLSTLQIDKLTPLTGGLRWPFSHSSLVNCSTLQEITDLEFVAAGWTKAVYKGKFRGRDVAVKTVNLNGHDIQQCLKRSGATLPVCYRRAAAKIIKEIILLTELAHDNMIAVLGSCVPDAVGPVAMVTELGDPLDTVQLLQLSWEDRLRLALGIAHILHHLAHSPLGSLAMNDFRRQQFVMVGGTLKLSDVDDIGVNEPSCFLDMDCQSKNITEGLVCDDAQCKGHNERLNIWRAGQHFIRLFLPLSAPASLEPHIQELMSAYLHPVEWDSQRILEATQDLVDHFVSGKYRAKSTADGITSLGFEKVTNSDLPGQFDYRCHNSISSVNCVMSVFNEVEAAEICIRDPGCKAVVLGKEQTWTGRTLAIFKNGYDVPSSKQGFNLLVKKSLS